MTDGGQDKGFWGATYQPNRPAVGISSVRCSWGGAQEAAALAQLAAAFPAAMVEEVSFCSFLVSLDAA